MIHKISGRIDQVSENCVILAVNGISYEVFIPTAVMKSLEGKLTKDSDISLITYHYYQTDPSKSIPILIGFSNKMEREFFEKFITVSGVGPKAAVRALSMPIAEIAQAIDSGSLEFLKSLPGIGQQRAKEIIAKLQGKMGKFGLIQGAASNTGGESPRVSVDLQAEALEVLLQLQYRKEEAKEMIRKAFARRPDMQNVEEVLNEVYRQKKGAAS